MPPSLTSTSTEASPEKSREALLESLSRRVTLIGSIIAILVALNTMVSSWGAQSAAREKSFRDAVELEETFWRERYSEYISLFADNIGEGQRRARLFVLNELINRPVPSFEEFKAWRGDHVSRTLAVERLNLLSTRLREALATPGLSDPAVIQVRQAENFQRTVETGGHDRAQRIAEAEPVAATISGPTEQRIVYGTRTIAVGDPRGWDVDVFWCANAAEPVASVNYGEGLRIARIIAAQSELNGDPRGRVRLAMLPLERQGEEYPRTGVGREIRPDSGDAAERAVARQISELLARSGLALRQVDNDGGTSRYYLSLFVCSGPLDTSRPRSNSEPR